MITYFLSKALANKEIYIKEEDVPGHLATKEWISKRGFKVRGKGVAFFKIEDSIHELYDKNEAIKYVDGADLSFTGNYYFAAESEIPPHYLKPLTYYKKYGIEITDGPIAKYTGKSSFIDLYKRPNPKLNKKEKQDLLNKHNITDYNGEIYTGELDELPEYVATKEMLVKEGLVVPEFIFALLFEGKCLYKLFNKRDAELLTATKKEQNTPEGSYRKYNLNALESGEWIGHEEYYVILDTETTGYGKDDEIIQLSIVDMNGKVLFNELFNPEKEKFYEATKVHGLKKSDLEHAHKWQDKWPIIQEILTEKTILMHNASFDLRLIEQTCQRYKVDYQVPARAKCTLNFFGKNYKVKKLKDVLVHFGIEHSSEKLHEAVTDCLMCLKALKKAHELKEKIDEDAKDLKVCHQ